MLGCKVFQVEDIIEAVNDEVYRYVKHKCNAQIGNRGFKPSGDTDADNGQKNGKIEHITVIDYVDQNDQQQDIHKLDDDIRQPRLYLFFTDHQNSDQDTGNHKG